VDRRTSRVIAIIPPEDTHSLRPGTPVTDVRLDAAYYRWVREGDVRPGVQSVSLIGGNLERCLGAAGEELMLTLEKDNSGSTELHLPLEAIYTGDDISALTALGYFRDKAEPLEAVVALLSRPDAMERYNLFLNLLVSSGRFSYELRLNGESLATLLPKPDIPLGEKPSSAENVIPGITWSLPTPESHPPPMRLALTGDINNGVPELPPALRETLDTRLAYAKTFVLPEYEVRTRSH